MKIKKENWPAVLKNLDELKALHAKRDALWRELDRALHYEHALAMAGLEREQVSGAIVGQQVGACDNYKATVAARRCKNPYCLDRFKYQPLTVLECPACQTVTVETLRRITPHELRTKYAFKIVGVILNDEKKVWFESPLP